MADESPPSSSDMFCLRASTLQKTMAHTCGYFRSCEKTKEGGKKSGGNSCSGFRKSTSLFSYSSANGKQYKPPKLALIQLKTATTTHIIL